MSILKVSKTHKGKIFVEIDNTDGNPPIPLSYVVFPDTEHNGKECQYATMNGMVNFISVDDVEVWPNDNFTRYFIPEMGTYEGIVPTKKSISVDTYVPAIDVDGVYHPDPEKKYIGPGDPFYVITPHKTVCFHGGANLECQWRTFVENTKFHERGLVSFDSLQPMQAGSYNANY